MSKSEPLTLNRLEAFLIGHPSALTPSSKSVALAPSDPRTGHVVRVRRALAREPALKAALEAGLERARATPYVALPPALAEQRARLLSAAELARPQDEPPPEVIVFREELERYLAAVEGFGPGAGS